MKTSPWWHDPFRAFQTNIREIDAGLDVEAVLDFIEDYGADTWLLSVGGIIANYPSRLASQTVNPALSQRATGDLIGDATRAAQGRGIRVLGRMDFSKVDARRAEEHPEWCYVDPTGSPQIYNGYRSVCPAGQYYQKEMFDVVSEVLSRYDISGFFFNMMHFNERDYSRRYWGVCHCESCQARFRAYAPGLEHPTGPDSPGYATWLTYSNGVLEDLNVRMREHIASINPNAALILKDGAHITYYEANNAVGRPLWHLATSEAVSAARSSEPDRAVFVNGVGFVDMPYRWAGEDPNHFAQYLLQAIAHGGRPSTYVMGTPEVGSYQGLKIGAQLTRFHRDNAETYAGLRSAARVGLVKGGRPEDPDGNRRQAEFRGLYQSLTETHVPFDVVRQDLLAEVPPDRYTLLLLPDLGRFTDAEVEAIEAFLAAGGSVVATGDSGWSEGLPQFGDAPPLAHQKAAYLTQESLFSLHVPVDDSGDHVPVLGGFQVLEPRDSRDGDWRVLGRSLYGPPEKCYGNEPTPHPGWIAGKVGGGRLAFVPWRPGLVYHEIGLQRLRDAFIRKTLNHAGTPLQADTDLPAQVQLVWGTNRAGSIVLHLLNRSGDVPQRFIDPLPITPKNLRIPLSHEPTGVRALVEGAELDWTFEQGLLTLTTPTIDRFEVLEIYA